MALKRTGRKVSPPLSKINSSKYNLFNLNNHWELLSKVFAAEYSDWIAVFDKIINLTSRVRQRLEGKKRLSENCAYLLLTKTLNHSIASYTLLEKGLTIDAALSARNALETSLMLELFTTDETEKYFESWATGKKFSPSDVRKKLADLQEVAVRDVIIDFCDGHYEGIRELYGFLSEITHANLESLQHSVSKEGEQEFEVFMGGSLEGQETLIHLIFRELCLRVMSTTITCAVVFDLPFYEAHRSEFEKIWRTIKQTTSKNQSSVKLG